MKEEKIKTILKSVGYSALIYSIIFGFVSNFRFLYLKSFYWHPLWESFLLTVFSIFILISNCYFIINAKYKKENFPWIKIIISNVIILFLLAILLLVGGSMAGGGEGGAFYAMAASSIFIGYFIFALIFPLIFGILYYKLKDIMFILLLIIILIIYFYMTYTAVVTYNSCYPSDYHCIKVWAVEERDINLCDRIKVRSGPGIQMCYNYYLQEGAKGDSSLCARVSDKIHEEACLGQLALSNNDLSFCSRASSQCSKAGCCRTTLGRLDKNRIDVEIMHSGGYGYYTTTFSKTDANICELNFKELKCGEHTTYKVRD